MKDQLNLEVWKKLHLIRDIDHLGNDLDNTLYFLTKF